MEMEWNGTTTSDNPINTGTTTTTTTTKAEAGVCSAQRKKAYLIGINVVGGTGVQTKREAIKR